MREIALHLLDIAENSVTAGAHTITLAVCEDLQHDRLTASVTDDGKGMDAEMVAKVVDPFVTSRTTRKVGLGIPLFKAAAEACNGGLVIQSEVGKGTCLEVDFQHSHIDRMPLGDLASTLLALVVAFPQIRWIFQYTTLTATGKRPETFDLDTLELHNELGDIPLTEPAVLAFLRETIENGISQAHEALNNERLAGYETVAQKPVQELKT
jgi:anti-sigma regulatory factor (Ser/Thr protein kinase)